MKCADAQHQQRAIEDDILGLLGIKPEPQKSPFVDSWEKGNVEDRARRDQQKLEWQQDPVGAERRQYWDQPGDVGRHPDIEWVPTHELKKFIEYDRRPGASDAHSSPERWRELGNHIRENGFKNPAVLEFNPDTGMAHMGEGNHRTWLALEHGIPAMPVRVYRSRRSSPTQVPVTIHPQPGWSDHRGEIRVPDSLKPSHIGLPTVPEPGWQRQSMRKWAASTMYHVAPRSSRASILKHGLQAHRPNHPAVVSPWDITHRIHHDQPKANYLFDHPDNAAEYVAVLASQANQHRYPGDFPELFADHGIYVDRPNKLEPEASAYIDDEFGEQPYHHNLHADRLPPHLQGYDIWRTLLRGDQHLGRDPEIALMSDEENPWLTAEEAQAQAGLDDDVTPRRWMTMDPVYPDQLSLYKHIPAWQVNDAWAEDASDRALEHQIPVPFARIGPKEPEWT